MKNNRQIGLDGKIFISDCLKRSVYFVYGLIIFGIVGAVADILKLLGGSGAVMSTFTTTLLVYDFISMLVLIIVTFYAHFLECGGNIPVLKGHPLVFLCWFRMGYSILLSYYIAYRVLYIMANPGNGQAALMIYYLIYFVVIFLSIISDTFIINILTRNIIRRSYEKSFNRLSRIGIFAQILLPIAYIFARIFLKDLGDEWFTASICDFLRLCLAPILYTSLWFIYVGAVKQVGSVFEEVDTALREKRYQITYSDANQPKGLKSGGRKKRKKNSVRKNAAHLPPPKKAAALSDKKESSDNVESSKEEPIKDSDDNEKDDKDNKKGGGTPSDSGENKSTDTVAEKSSKETSEQNKDTGKEKSGETEPAKKKSAPVKEKGKQENKKSVEELRREEAMRIRQQVRYVNPAAPQLQPSVQDFDPYAAPVAAPDASGSLRLAPRSPQPSGNFGVSQPAVRAVPSRAQKPARTAPANSGSVYFPPKN